MGQRLVVSVYKNKNEASPFMSIYYHWSAYTVTALVESLNIIKSYRERKRSLPFEAALIVSLETIGARIDPQDSLYIQNKYPDIKFDLDNVDRNFGLIALSEERIAQQLQWAEGLANVYLEEEEILNDCMIFYENETEYNDYIISMYDDDDCDVAMAVELSTLNYDPSQLNAKEVEAFLFDINNNHRDEYAFKLKDGTIIEFIC